MHVPCTSPQPALHSHHLPTHLLKAPGKVLQEARADVLRTRAGRESRHKHRDDGRKLFRRPGALRHCGQQTCRVRGWGVDADKGPKLPNAYMLTAPGSLDSRWHRCQEQEIQVPCQRPAHMVAHQLHG